MPILLLVTPVISTLIGGLLALRFRRSLSLLVAVSAGLLLGAAFLDLLPEAITQGQVSGVGPADILAVTLASFLVFFAIETAISTLSARKHQPVPPRAVGRIAGVMLIFHSFRDGMAIGASFAVSHAAGYAVTVGIAAHDLGDGMNTVLLTTGGETPGPTEIAFLAGDAIAPFAGGLIAYHWFTSPNSAGLLLATAAGFFLQMATSDFLPHIRQCNKRLRLMSYVVLGTLVIYFANRMVGQLH